jgi:hypothetical protein
MSAILIVAAVGLALAWLWCRPRLRVAGVWSRCGQTRVGDARLEVSLAPLRSQTRRVLALYITMKREPQS